MPFRIVCGLLLTSGLFLQTGCALVDFTRQSTVNTLRMFKPRQTDYRDETEEEDDQWDFVGQEARGTQKRERDPDRWWRKWIMSEKARSIERNVGID